MITDYLIVYEYPGFQKKRLGAKGDGGYVIIENIGDYDYYLSCGVSDEESFTRDFLNLYNMQDKSAAFDGTITDYPRIYSEHIKFFKNNIGDVNTEYITNLHDYLTEYKDIFIKMDIEGGEYPWITSLTPELLDNVKQIVIEIHGIVNGGFGADIETKIACLKKLQDTHVILHAHGNNNCDCVNGVPDVIELTYVRKRDIPLPIKLNTYKLPISGLDFPNVPLPEINLSHECFGTIVDIHKNISANIAKILLYKKLK